MEKILIYGSARSGIAAFELLWNKKDIFYNLILLVVDYISGMTDSFALKVSKLF